MKKENSDKVIDWIRSGMDYYKGLELLVSLTDKPQLRSVFNGGMKSMSGKLAYEICKASDVADVVTWKKFIQDNKTENALSTEGVISLPFATKGNTSDTGRLPNITDDNRNQMKVFVPSLEIDMKEATLEENPLKDYPAIIRRVMYEYASIFQERSKLHAVMTEMDSSNAPAVMMKRAELFDLIKALSDKLERFYLAKEKYELDGTIPIEDELFPPDPEPKQSEDISLLDEEGLKNRKKNLQNGNSKDQSILDYQSAKHGSTKNPMPNGPKRFKIEYRIKQRNKQLEEIDTELLKYVIKQ